MTALLLFDVDQLTPVDRNALAAIMVEHHAYMIAVYPDGTMRVLVEKTCVESFLETVARGVLTTSANTFAQVA